MRLAQELRGHESPPFATGPLSQAAIALALVLLLSLWLVAMGRPLICDCGTVSLFVADVHSAETSQQFADWYSLLHVVFGFALFYFLDWLKPAWSTGQKLLIAIASSVVWEGVENLPAVIALFGNLPGAPPYAGDSVLNAIADTLFVAAGFLLARIAPIALVLSLAVLFEIVVLTVAGDGYLLGAMRLVGLPV